VVSGLNHLAHKINNYYDQEKPNHWDTNDDGKISLSEANEWYRNGDGKSITLEASKVDLNFIDTKDWVKGSVYTVQTLFRSEQGRVLGNIRVEYLGNNQVRILSDTYNFEQHGSYLSSPIRNPANTVGRWVAGEGNQFKINFSGINTIKPTFRVYNFERGPKY